MKTKYKIILMLILVIVLIASTVFPAMAGTNAPKLTDYVAMGDSGAAGVRAVPGQLPGFEDGSDYGYTDLIANWLSEDGVLGKFDEKYSISGNTAAELAVETTKADGYQRLKNAEIVTLTIGANDLLGPLYAYFDAGVEGGTEFSIPGALVALNECMVLLYGAEGLEMKNDIKKILENTLSANPDVKIYIMGYYNPLPCLVDYGYDLAPHVMVINAYINLAIYETMLENPLASIEYIETLELINGYSAPTYLYGSLYPYYYEYLYADLIVPIADIHLTEEGYAKVAESFISAIADDM